MITTKNANAYQKKSRINMTKEQIEKLKKEVNEMCDTLKAAVNNYIDDVTA